MRQRQEQTATDRVIPTQQTALYRRVLRNSRSLYICIPKVMADEMEIRPGDLIKLQSIDRFHTVISPMNGPIHADQIIAD